MKIFFYTKHKIHGYESNWPYYFRCFDSDYSNTTAFILIRKKLEKIFTSIVFMDYHDASFKFNDPADDAAFQLYRDSDMDIDI